MLNAVALIGLSGVLAQLTAAAPTAAKEAAALAYEGNTYRVAAFFTAAHNNDGAYIYIDADGLNPKENYAYGIYEKPVPDDGDCSAAGALYDPKSSKDGDCDHQYPEKCAYGDLSGKHGTLYPNKSGQYRHYFHDHYVFLSGDSAVIGRSIVIHQPNSDEILACATILGEEDFIKHDSHHFHKHRQTVKALGTPDPDDNHRDHASDDDGDDSTLQTYKYGEEHADLQNSSSVGDEDDDDDALDNDEDLEELAPVQQRQSTRTNHAHHPDTVDEFRRDAAQAFDEYVRNQHHHKNHQQSQARHAHGVSVGSDTAGLDDFQRSANEDFRNAMHHSGRNSQEQYPDGDGGANFEENAGSLDDFQRSANEDFRNAMHISSHHNQEQYPNGDGAADFESDSGPLNNFQRSADDSFRNAVHRSGRNSQDQYSGGDGGANFEENSGSLDDFQRSANEDFRNAMHISSHNNQEQYLGGDGAADFESDAGPLNGGGYQDRTSNRHSSHSEPRQYSDDDNGGFIEDANRHFANYVASLRREQGDNSAYDTQANDDARAQFIRDANRHFREYLREQRHSGRDPAANSDPIDDASVSV